MWFGVSLIGIVEHLAQEGGKEQAIEYFTREYVNILHNTTVLTGAPGLVSTIPWPRYRSLTLPSWMESPVSVVYNSHFQWSSHSSVDFGIVETNMYRTAHCQFVTSSLGNSLLDVDFPLRALNSFYCSCYEDAQRLKKSQGRHVQHGAEDHALICLKPL